MYKFKILGRHKIKKVANKSKNSFIIYFCVSRDHDSSDMLGVESENTLKAAHCLHNRSASINSHKTVEMTVSQTSCHIIQRKILYPSKGRKGNFQITVNVTQDFTLKG